jgi:hypothetical protein
VWHLGAEAADILVKARDQVIREKGTETSAEVLVGPPWRMESNAGQQQWYESK